MLHGSARGDYIDLTSKIYQGKLGSTDQNEDSGNAVLSIENAYCNTEEGSVKDFRKPRSENFWWVIHKICKQE
jgi:hypothetical protein